MAYRPPNPNGTEPRYTTVALVKERLAIEATDVSRDDDLKRAVVGGEYAIDAYLGRGFPDLPGDVNVVGQWTMDTNSNLILPPTNGELNMDSSQTLYEMSKTDANSVDHSAVKFGTVPFLIMDFPLLPSDAYVYVDVPTIVDNGTWWAFTGELRQGAIPTGVVVLTTITITAGDWDASAISVVPESVKMAALSMAIATWKEADSPTGSAGSDAFMGAITVQDTARNIVQRTPGLAGFKVAAGFGIAGPGGLTNG